MKGFRNLDTAWTSIARSANSNDGSCAIVAVIINKWLHVANLGDSRAVLCSDGQAVQLSTDHKPNSEGERSRIESQGGFVAHFGGTHRLMGVLATSRAIGNPSLKPALSATPEVTSRQLKAGDDFLIIGSDGLWDVISNSDAVAASLLRPPSSSTPSPPYISSDHLFYISQAILYRHFHQ
eukprot:CAMPEP_0114488196 /NCGR_PEP_ID=MMETSP0109-20121206/1191_1 /TAXON_ID=29199 /ORGANISM="Chlorarachnion reptans, Strain CCCM449" /LENGTH=179 /DNA_ID=CAMNT_0001664553 /DNA_START=274 /DNA_END=813 /DNA_ORIENTATION=+